MSDEPHGDLKAAVQMLAADNARMCDIIIAADKLADTLAGVGAAYGPGAKKLNDALAAYKAVRNGQ